MPLGDLVKPAHKSNYDESVAKDMPIFPGASLAAHVVLKNIQLGSTLGSFVGLGMWLRGPERKVSTLLLKTWPRFAGIGGAAGILTGGAMIYFKMQSIDLEGLEDRAYRIALNRGVKSADFYSVVGGTTFMMLGFAARRMGAGGSSSTGAKKIMSPWSQFAQGIAVGTVGYGLGNMLGLPVHKPLETLRVRGFESETVLLPVVKLEEPVAVDVVVVEREDPPEKDAPPEEPPAPSTK